MIVSPPVPLPPLHRWKSFWFGIFVLLLAGSWLRSIHFAEKVTFGDPMRSAFVQTGQSGGMYFLSISHRPESMVLTCYHPFIGRSGDTIVAWRNPHGSPRYELPPPADGILQPTWWELWISHWLLGLLFLLPWIAFLARRRHLMRGMETMIIPTHEAPASAPIP